MDSRVAILGDSESIKGFAAVGVDVFPCERGEEGAATFRRVAEGGEYAVLLMTEDLFEALEKERNRLAGALLPAIVPLPGVTSDKGVGVARLRSFVEKAVGSDIIFND